MKFTVFWDVAPCSQVDFDRRFRDAYCFRHQVMKALRTSETSVNINYTWRYIPEDSKVHTRRRENLKSHKIQLTTNRPTQAHT
jgi:hypothetical protein